MRKESLFAFVAVLAVCLSGCAAKFESAQKSDDGVHASDLQRYAEQQRGRSHWFGSTESRSGRQRVPATNQDSVAANPSTARTAQTPPSDLPYQVSESGPSSRQLHIEWGRQLERAGDAHGGSAHFKKVLALEPKNLDALLGIAHLMDRQGQFQHAVHYYEIATRDHPQVPAAFNDLGLCLARMNQLEQAVGPLSQAVALDPQRKLYRNNIGTVLVELGRVDEALEHMLAVHGAAISHYNVGFLLQRRGQPRIAAEHFALAAAISPSFAAARKWADQLDSRVDRQPQVHSVSHPVVHDGGR